MQSEKHLQRDISHIQKLINIGDVAMLVSRSGDGIMKSRPMETVEVSAEGELFFFTTLSSELIGELTENSFVNLSFIKEDNHFISVSGITQVIKSKAMLIKLWESRYETWIQDGLDNPDIALLKVSLVRAEHWKHNTMLSSIRQLFTLGVSAVNNVHESIEPDESR
jgi:general stress protein 26